MVLVTKQDVPYQFCPSISRNSHFFETQIVLYFFFRVPIVYSLHVNLLLCALVPFLALPFGEGVRQ